MTIIKELEESNFIRVAIRELRDKLDEKLHTYKIFKNQIETLSQLEQDIKSKNKTSK